MVFTTCANGHDLTLPDAFLYRSNGARDCRHCSKHAQPKRGARRGTFNSTVAPRETAVKESP